MQSIYSLILERYNFNRGLLNSASNVVQQKLGSFYCLREN
jgi:hypothetical protein